MGGVSAVVLHGGPVLRHVDLLGAVGCLSYDLVVSGQVVSLIELHGGVHPAFVVVLHADRVQSTSKRVAAGGVADVSLRPGHQVNERLVSEIQGAVPGAGSTTTAAGGVGRTPTDSISARTVSLQELAGRGESSSLLIWVHACTHVVAAIRQFAGSGGAKSAIFDHIAGALDDAVAAGWEECSESTVGHQVRRIGDSHGVVRYTGASVSIRKVAACVHDTLLRGSAGFPHCN